MMEQKQEDQKSNENVSVCAATVSYSAQRKLYYIEKDKTLSEEHRKMYNDVRNHVDNVLAKKVVWELVELDPNLMSLVPSEDTDQKQSDSAKPKANPADKQYATAEMYQYLATFATEATIVRSITGSDYRVEVAKKAVLETVQWRVSSKVDSITPEMFKDSIKLKVVFSKGTKDKKGHLICCFKVLEVPPEDPWQMLRAAIWTVEKSVKIAEQQGLYQTTWLADIENLAYATMPPMAILKQIAHIMQHYYPERLSRAYLLYSPWVFRMIWKMVSGLLTENTKGKIIVPGWDESGKYETFQDHIDKDSLEKRFGGNLDFEYSYEYEVEQFNKSDGYTK